MEQPTEYIKDGMNGFERNVKRVADCLAAAVCLILFSPIFLICYIGVRREDGGPAIYKQERIGRFGRPFYIYKFRSMVVGAENNGPELCQDGGDDQRLTQFGKFLRLHHLDELPQFWNVFMGQMSLEYLRHRSWALDIKIIGLTFTKILFGRKI